MERPSDVVRFVVRSDDGENGAGSTGQAFRAGSRASPQRGPQRLRSDSAGAPRGCGAAETKSALRLEAEAAAVDPDDVAEAVHVREEMDAIAAAWNDAG